MTFGRLGAEAIRKPARASSIPFVGFFESVEQNIFIQFLTIKMMCTTCICKNVWWNLMAVIEETASVAEYLPPHSLYLPQSWFDITTLQHS